jgi:hypothetical protein
MALETFVLYRFGPDGTYEAKEFFEGEKALVEAAGLAVGTGEFPEIRGTDLLDRLVLRIVDGEVVFPALNN